MSRAAGGEEVKFLRIGLGVLGLVVSENTSYSTAFRLDWFSSLCLLMSHLPPTTTWSVVDRGENPPEQLDRVPRRKVPEEPACGPWAQLSHNLACPGLEVTGTVGRTPSTPTGISLPGTPAPLPHPCVHPSSCCGQAGLRGSEAPLPAWPAGMFRPSPSQGRACLPGLGCDSCG